MKFLTNTFDPNHVDAKRYFTYRSNKDRDEQWQVYLHWLSDKIIGLPQATDLYTVEQLINMNIVGVYRR